MSLGFKGSTKRRIILIGLAVFALGLIAAPVAMAVDGMVLGGITEGKWAGGIKELSAKVSVYAPGVLPSDEGATPLFTTDSTESGMWLMTVTGVPPTYYADFPIYAFADHFNMATSSFTYIPGGAGTAGDLQLTVLNTTISGTVKAKGSGKVLKGVKVLVLNKVRATTPKTGKYSVKIGLWPASHYTIKFVKTGYRTVKKTITSNPGGSVVRNVSMVKK